MNKLNLKKFCSNVKDKGSKFLKKIKPYTPQIKIAGGVVCLLGAVGYSSVAGRKANQLLTEKKKETMTEELTPMEVVKTTGKVYIPVIGMSIAGAGLVYSGTNDILKRNAALVGRYNIAVENAKAYKEAISKEIGEDKFKELTKKIVAPEPEVKEEKEKETKSTDKPKTRELFKDELSGYFFWDTLDHVKQVNSDLNLSMYRDAYGAVLSSDMLNRFNISHTPMLSDFFFWTIEDGDISFMYDGNHRTTIEDETQFGVPVDIPYTLIKQLNPPRMDIHYNNF